MKSIHKTAVVFLILFFLAQFNPGQGLPTTRPEQVSLSSKRLERIKPIIIMQSYIDQGKLPGFFQVEVGLFQLPPIIYVSPRCYLIKER